MKLLVTGGCGFIGSNFILKQVQQHQNTVLNLDKLTYAGNSDNLLAVSMNNNYSFIEGDIIDSNLLSELFNSFHPEAVVHFAAESHVDRSIDGPIEFIQTNIVGTATLLDTALDYWQSIIDKENRRKFRFLHISTDEVFGSLENDGLFTENTPYDPSSPYSASKAGSDHLVRAYYKTYGLPTLTTRGSNTYGPRQFPEKFIPLVILKALSGQSLPVYGDGQQVREWIHVDDHVAGILAVLARGEIGESYNIGSGFELKNIELVKSLCDKLGIRCPGKDFSKMIKFVEDRPGHDRRYALDSSRANSEISWAPRISFEEGLRDTVDWYLANQGWCRAVSLNSP